MVILSFWMLAPPRLKNSLYRFAYLPRSFEPRLSVWNVANRCQVFPHFGGRTLQIMIASDERKCMRAARRRSSSGSSVVRASSACCAFCPMYRSIFVI